MRTLWLLLIVALSIFTSACGGQGAPNTPNDSPAQPIAIEHVDLEGTWVSSGDLVFEADVSPVGIEIYWKADATTSGLYWKGDLPGPIADGITTVSTADKEALAGSIFGSSEPTKEFTYEDGKLSFDFEAMGLKHVIHLEKQ